MVERNLAKVEVASSSLVSRSKLLDGKKEATGFLFSCHNVAALPAQRSARHGAIAKRLCNGLQIRLARFDSGSRLQTCRSPGPAGAFVFSGIGCGDGGLTGQARNLCDSRHPGGLTSGLRDAPIITALFAAWMAKLVDAADLNSAAP